MKGELNDMKKILKRLATGFLAFATIVTALQTTAVHTSEKQYWTESAERVGIVEKVMNDGSIGSIFAEKQHSTYLFKNNAVYIKYTIDKLRTAQYDIPINKTLVR